MTSLHLGACGFSTIQRNRLSSENQEGTRYSDSTDQKDRLVDVPLRPAGLRRQTGQVHTGLRLRIVQPGYRLLILTTASYWSRASIVVPMMLLVLILTRNLRSLPDWARAGRANPIIPGRNAVSRVRRFMCLPPSLGMQR